ncbi:MAG: MarR family winged helix-turn-helix transcriptional regulator [Fusobacteriaceae bacterium]
MKNVNRVNGVLEEFFKLFYKTEDMALKVGIKGLTHTELHIIDAINSDTLTMHELSDRLGTTMGTATVAVSKLSEKGFITRTRSELDRRKVYVALDKKGLEALIYHNNYHNMLLSSITENVALPDLEKFIEIFEVILNNLSNKTGFFKPLPLDEFSRGTKVSVVAIKGTPIIQDFFEKNGIKNFSTVEVYKTGKEIEILTFDKKIIKLDALDAKNLICTKI